ncbi:hypothetical protein [Candidatus Williamhamiltonella defendens]|uniref:Uncharacterized protein n=1 Tax=Candidatus Williamhamiltonella defendens TaxID=138072 RepID=A0A2D3TD31_9ENTR|nr:hypothetical protein [Candidatus Hamiltonella defensa]ATW33604.1 hypothetical protein BJP43_04155 [Candidatus Hamiltonella defensa]AYB48355.1 hypothetical protein CJJ19_01185 [Candidatus Hamiltonella defensa]
MHVRHANQKPSIICRKGHLHLLILFIKEYAHENTSVVLFLCVLSSSASQPTMMSPVSGLIEPVNTALGVYEKA